MEQPTTSHAINSRKRLERCPTRAWNSKVLFDPEATISLISKDASQRLRLKGLNVTLSITKVGNVSDMQRSKEYYRK